jgi:hypothetical protein
MATNRIKIFNDQVTKYGGSLRAERGIKIIYQPLDRTATGAKGTRPLTMNQSRLIVQQFNIQVQRPLQTLFDLASNCAFYVAGKVQSSVSMEKIVGPQGISEEFYKKFGDVCQGAANLVWFVVAPEKCSDFFADSGTKNAQLSARSSYSSAPDKSQQSNVVEVQALQLTTASFTANVQNYLVTESCQMTGMDVSLKWTDMSTTAYGITRQLTDDQIATSLYGTVV